MDVTEELRQAVIDYDEEAAVKGAEKVLELQMDPYKVITDCLTPAIQEVGNRFECGEAFLPELIMATDAMEAAVKVLEKGIAKEKLDQRKKGRIVLGTVKGDIHNIGKNIVGIMLKTAGSAPYSKWPKVMEPERSAFSFLQSSFSYRFSENG